MPHDPRVDAYIAQAPEFARPILKHVRTLAHEACPEVTETIKWSMPFFERHGLLFCMAAFKRHCAIGFWRGIELDLPDRGKEAMGQLGRITSLADLPSRAKLLGYFRSAVAQRAAKPSGASAAAPRRPAKPVTVPADFKAALAKNRRAAATFEKSSPSCRREYVDWITDAKRPETRERRLATSIEWLAEGKQRNWKYQ